MSRAVAFFAAAAVLIGLAAGAWLVIGRSGEDPFAQCRSERVAGAAKIGGPFELVNGRGETVTDSDVITRPTLIYFGYTFCPDFCPNDMSRNAIVVDALREKGHELGLVFVSIDPERDTPQAVADFAANIDPNIVGLTGSPEQTEAAATAYRVFHRKASDEEFYLVDHSTFTYLMAPDAGFVTFYGTDVSAEAMTDSLACYAEALG